MADYDTESNQSSEDDSSDGLDYGKSVQLLSSKLSSWEYILQSIKNLRKSGQHVDFSTILNAAKQAVFCQDHASAVKLFATAFAQKLSASEPHFMPKDLLMNLIECQEIVCTAISQCVSIEEWQLKQKGRTLESKVQELKQSIQIILSSYDKLSLMDTLLLSQASSFYLRAKEYPLALDLGNRAVALDPLSTVAQEIYENICCHLVERWHFVMLNDESRNRSYQIAILKGIDRYQTDVSVCDVGCGTGLLSLIAAKHSNCSHVYAIEKLDVMADLAREVLDKNLESDCARKIKLINKMSSKMSIPNDLPNEAQILVTETFDAGLFGEGILPTLCHAWSKLLNSEEKKMSLVIPSAAKLYVQAIESEAIFKESRLKPGADMFGLDHSSMCVCSTVGMCRSDPYTTHDLKKLRGGFRPLSEPLRFMDVNFNNPQELTRLNRGVSRHFELAVTEAGRVDALAMWFSLCLLDAEEISTHTDRNSCWEQAIFPANPWMLRESGSSLEVDIGDILKVDQVVRGAKHSMCLSDVDRVSTRDKGDVSPDGPVENDYPNHQTFLTNTLEWCKKQVYCLSSAEIVALNNTRLHQALTCRLHELLPREETDTQADFIHLNNGFSPLCLQALRMGYRQAWAAACSPMQQVLIWKLAQENRVDLAGLTLLRDAEEYCADVSAKREHVEEESQEEIGLMKEDYGDDDGGGCRGNTESAFMQLPEMRSQKCVVVLDIVDWQGRLLESLPEKVMMMRECVSTYKEVNVVPHCVDVCGVLIESEELLRLSRVVSDECTLGYNIGAFINKFSTRNHQGIFLESLPHTKLCQPFKLFTLDLERLVIGPDHPSAAKRLAETTASARQDSPHNSHSHSSSDAGSNLWTRQSSSFDEASVNSNGVREKLLGAESSAVGHEEKRESRTDTEDPSLPQLKRKQCGTDHVQTDMVGASSEGCSSPKNLRENGDGVAPPHEAEDFDQSVNLSVTITAPGTVTALLYWFDQHMSDPGSASATTGNHSSFTTTASAASHPAMSFSAGTLTPAMTSSSPTSAASASLCPFSATSTLSATASLDHGKVDTATLIRTSPTQILGGTSFTDQPCPTTIPSTPTHASTSSTTIPTLPPRPADFDSVSSLNPSHHWQQAAVMTHPSQSPCTVAAGDSLKLRCTMGSSAFSFWIDN